MTVGVQPIVPREYPIQVAENEGLPPAPDVGQVSPPAVRARRQHGTLRLGRPSHERNQKGLVPKGQSQ